MSNVITDNLAKINILRAEFIKNGFSAQKYDDVIRGKSRFTVDEAVSISEKFQLSLDYLLTGKEPQKEIAPELTEDETKVLKYYNRLTGEEKDYIKGEMVRLNMAAISNKSDVEFADELAT